MTTIDGTILNVVQDAPGSFSGIIRSEAVYPVGTQENTTAIVGRNDVDDYYGIGVIGTGGWRGVSGQVFPTGLDFYTGVQGLVDGGSGINYGVAGISNGGNTNYGVYGFATGGGANNYGVYGSASFGATNIAGFFDGDLETTGNLSKASGTFKIDHPLDPENKYLYHSFVESPDMMNVYNGNVILDANGEAIVEMDDWFQPLNRDFRYQLTAIGAPGPNLYIAEKIANNRFKIAGGTPGTEVSWQVTGIRKDPYANQNRIQVEVEKALEKKGTYLHPEAYNQPEERGEFFLLKDPKEHRQ